MSDSAPQMPPHPPRVPWNRVDLEIIAQRRQLWKQHGIEFRHWNQELCEAETREKRDAMLIEQLAVCEAIHGTAGRSIEEARQWAADVLRTMYAELEPPATQRAGQ